jgi:hypothetical protein
MPVSRKRGETWGIQYWFLYHVLALVPRRGSESVSNPTLFTPLL